MGPDSYLVEVIHFLNPHLIWVEVVDSKEDDYVFEQIGIYGILPFETTLTADGDGLKVQRCEEWVPAASLLMKKCFAEAREIWFTPTFIDRRTSIFDDNIHKFGELTIVKKNEDPIELSTILNESGFSLYDICLFHQELSLGNLKTKLNYNKTQEVVRQLEKGVTSRPSKRHRESSVKKQTKVFHAAQNFETSLTTTNLERHNHRLQPGASLPCAKIEMLMQKKSKDFDRCKDIDEVSVGRGSRTKKTEKEKPQHLPMHLQKKLDMMSKPKAHHNPMHVLMATKKYLEENAVRMDTDSSETKSYDGRCEQPLKPILKKETSTTYEDEKPERPIMKDKEVNTTKVFLLRKPTRKMREAKHESKNIKRYAVGPPGLSPQAFYLRPAPTKEDDEENTVSNIQDGEETRKQDEIHKQRELFDAVDSDIDLEITNAGVLKEKLNPTHTENNFPNNDKENSFNTTICTDKSFNDSKYSLKSSSDRSVNESTSSADSQCNVKASTKFAFLKKKLQLLKDMKPKEISTTDVVSKDLSIDINPNDTFKNESLFFKDSPNMKSLEVVKTTSTPNTESTRIQNNVNPFKNIDPNISVFVEKLVSPVLMVHTKLGKRIEPCSNLRDVNFNTHIHVVLKNMNIERPMMLQMVSWPVILRGCSFFMIGPKHSGKTLGYLPAVCRLISDFKSEFVDSVGPTCIIVCATAESVSEVEHLAKMFLGLEEKVLAFYPGIEDLHMTTSLLNGCDLFICTPSVLVRLLQLTDFGIDLRRLSTFVLEDCERLSEVYANEVKFFLMKIREMLKSRANKELKVQYVVLSRVWCDFFEPLAKKAPNSVICIGAFQECVLYSKANTAVDFVKNENKQEKVVEFLKEIDTTKRTVIVCRTDDEVDQLKSILVKNKYVVFDCNSTMTVEDLYNLSKSWAEYQEPLLGPILLCCDDNLTHLNVTDAHHLVHYSLPRLFSMFCKRFAVLNDNYPSIFKTENQTVKIKVFLEETNVEQLPKILNFVKRCTDNVPEFLDTICEDILHEKDAIKAKNLVPICCNLLEYGECPDFWNCQDRHAVFKGCDEPKDWMPKKGVVTFKILHYLTPIHYSVRLLSNITIKETQKYPQAYSTLSLKMGLYFSKESNRRLQGIPKVGDVCAVSVKQHFFVRCQVLKILTTYNNGTPNCVLIKLIDEEKMEKTRDIYLFHLPKEFQEIETHVVQVRLANVCPRDKDITFSSHATEMLKKITKNDEDLYFRGQIVLTVGNCIFIDTLEACQELTSLSATVVRYNLKKELLDAHAIANPDHISKLEKLCEDCIDINKEETDVMTETVTKHKKEKAKPQWAHLEDNMSTAYLASAEDPGTFFMRLTKFESCMKLLLKDIEKHIEENPEFVSEISKDDIVLAKFPDDSTYERARIEEILSDTMVKCFFVDQGDWRDVLSKDLVHIPNRIINQMPFQAIECRLIGVKPAGEDWTEYGTNWFCDKCFETDSGHQKQLFVKYFTKEKATFTGGNKYGVAIIDTYSDQDVVINQLMIELNLAQANDEISYFDDFKLNEHKESSPDGGKSDEDDLEDMSKAVVPKESQALVPVAEETPKVSLGDIFMQKPIRSVPLVDSDNESDGSWSICNAHEFFPAFRDLISAVQNQNKNKDMKKDDTVTNAAKSDNSDLPTANVTKDDNATTDDSDLPTANVTKDENAAKTDDSDLPTVNVTKDENASKTDDSDLLTVNVTKDDSKATVSLLSATPVKGPSSVLDSDDFSSAGNTQVSENIVQTENPFNLKADELRKPKLCWRQNKSSVTIKIQLIGVDDYELVVKERSIKFDAYSNDTKYGFDFELYGVVDDKSVVHGNKGQYILVKLTKIMKRNWLTLTKDTGVRKWIVYDVDSIDTSSEEEEDFRDTLADYMKNVHKDDDSESDDDFLDDINYEYKRDFD